MTQVKEEIITNKMICQRFFDIPTIQNQEDKRQLNFIRKVTRKFDEQILMKLLTAQCNNKKRFGVVLHSKKNLVHNIALIVLTVDLYSSLKLWAYLTLYYRYWKYLINGIGNTATSPPVPPPSQNTKIAQPPSSPSTPRPIQTPPTSPPPRQSTRPSPKLSPREVPTPSISRTPRYDTGRVVKTGRDSLGVLLITGRSTEREIKTQYRILARIYHPDKHGPESTGMTSNQAEEHFNNINNAYDYFRIQL